MPHGMFSTLEGDPACECELAQNDEHLLVCRNRDKPGTLNVLLLANDEAINGAEY